MSGGGGGLTIQKIGIANKPNLGTKFFTFAKKMFSPETELSLVSLSSHYTKSFDRLIKY